MRLNRPIRDLDGDTPKALDKEKKKFWGMGWGDKKDKSSRRDFDDDGSRSVEMWRDGDLPSAHGLGEEEPRGRLLGLDLGRNRDAPLGSKHEETVTMAISKPHLKQHCKTDISRNAMRNVRSAWRKYL